MQTAKDKLLTELKSCPTTIRMGEHVTLIDEDLRSALIELLSQQFLPIQTDEELWQQYAEQYDGDLVMHKDSFIKALNDLAKLQLKAINDAYADGSDTGYKRALEQSNLKFKEQYGQVVYSEKDMIEACYYFFTGTAQEKAEYLPFIKTWISIYTNRKK